ncbi:hypothetical protein [Nonomuraea salmonea]|uniref:hypothetical protein n=1 Tax=Nonomuraea salmonea TaxID=46181 RepID=UPI0031E8DBD2
MITTRATYREVFAVGQFRVLFTGYTLYLGGETVKMLALSVTVYAGTGSPLLAALAYVAGFLPYALGGARSCWRTPTGGRPGR